MLPHVVAKHGEYLIKIDSTGTKLHVDIRSRIVILLPLCGITEHAIGFFDLLETMRVTALVWVMLAGQPSISAFYVFRIGLAIHAQDMVVVFHLCILAQIHWQDQIGGRGGGGGRFGVEVPFSLMVSHLLTRALPAQAAM